MSGSLDHTLLSAGSHPAGDRSVAVCEWEKSDPISAHSSDFYIPFSVLQTPVSIFQTRRLTVDFPKVTFQKNSVAKIATTQPNDIPSCIPELDTQSIHSPIHNDVHSIASHSNSFKGFSPQINTLLSTSNSYSLGLIIDNSSTSSIPDISMDGSFIQDSYLDDEYVPTHVVQLGSGHNRPITRSH